MIPGVCNSFGRIPSRYVCIPLYTYVVTRTSTSYATHCKTLQDAATRCNTLQLNNYTYVMTRTSTLYQPIKTPRKKNSPLYQHIKIPRNTPSRLRRVGVGVGVGVEWGCECEWVWVSFIHQIKWMGDCHFKIPRNKPCQFRRVQQ